MENIDLQSNLFFGILVLIDYFYLDYLCRGDQPGFRPILFLFLSWIFGQLGSSLSSAINRSESESPSSSPSEWNNRVHTPVTVPITTSIDEVFRMQAEALKNAEAERESDRIRYQRHINSTEQKIERFETWRMAVKIAGVIILVAHIILFAKMRPTLGL